MRKKSEDELLPAGSRSLVQVGGTEQDPTHDDVRIKLPSPARSSQAYGDGRNEPEGSRGTKGRFLPGNKAAVGKGKPKLMGLGLSRESIGDTADPEYRNCLIRAESYRRHRTRELLEAHGYVSGGVSAKIASASLTLAASRYLAQRAAKCKDFGDMTKLLKQSADMSRQADAAELSAWELCAREAVAHKRNKKAVLPWQVGVVEAEGSDDES